MIQSIKDRELIDPTENTILFVAVFCQTSLLPVLTTLSIIKDILLSHKNHSVASAVIVLMAVVY
jgi:1-deoxy-D-xylulose 5-phosphate reductoisomerase